MMGQAEKDIIVTRYGGKIVKKHSRDERAFLHGLWCTCITELCFTTCVHTRRTVLTELYLTTIFDLAVMQPRFLGIMELCPLTAEALPN